ncbi:PREDICTED: uncharacterized protein LOC105368655 [Ceratosolen solmsi marchali]|uniref:Uncharacterized protein LOC105368655 n=1 Tax=Ceratosolen solmsi marchali TaxID=326594 RepID=A0AAJ7E323_9HYME|nr:PREDICTED: uncharacterized protein LOC105368655 [Ceratosolen solmsi marchali]
MWKSVTRSIRESLERRTCRTNVYSQSTPDGNGNGNNIEQREFFTPIVVSSISHDYFGSTKQSGPQDNDEQNNYNAKFTWLNAVSWSSFLAAGFVVCQSLCLNRKLFEIDNKNLEKWRNKFLLYPQNQVPTLFSNFELPQPNQILVLSNKTKEYKSTTKILNVTDLNVQELYGPFTTHILPINNESNETEDTAETLNNDLDVHTLYGPITAEEAFEKAASEFSYTHKAIMGDLELRCGSQALEEKRYEDAIKHFIIGTKLSSTGSMFNLALCYELGLGTTVDFVKAVKYYKKAAKKGHIDAIYNLGVFYAQGKGGLKMNRNIARQLFTKAAKKGQIEALKALQLEESLKKHSDLIEKSKYNLKLKIENSIKKNVLTTLKNYDSDLTCLSEEVKSDKFRISLDENINSENSTNIFSTPSEENSYPFNVAWRVQAKNQWLINTKVGQWETRGTSSIKSSLI